MRKRILLVLLFVFGVLGALIFIYFNNGRHFVTYDYTSCGTCYSCFCTYKLSNTKEYTLDDSHECIYSINKSYSRMEITYLTDSEFEILEQCLKENEYKAPIKPSETTESEVKPISTNTNVYVNEELGFKIETNSEYKHLTDKDSLYGWKNALVLFYNGGQSYDVVVQIWDNVEDYKKEIPTNMEYVVIPINGKYLTISDITKEPNNQAILNSYRPL